MGITCQLGPRYEGQLTRMAEPILPSGQSSSYSLTTLSSSSSTDRRAETDRFVITTRIAVAHHFRCRLRRRESCILGATSSQPTLPLHELPPARLVIHRQTSAHERRALKLVKSLLCMLMVVIKYLANTSSYYCTS